ncbi:MAG TPA: hypothetical protein VI299_04190 [Polyangiales bacterium]
MPTLDDTSSLDPDAILEALPGGPPRFQFRADDVTLNGSSVTTIPNRRGTDALVVTAGTLAAPASDVLFGGAPSIEFSGTQWLDSNLDASAWKFLHDGTGAEIFLIHAPTTTAPQCMWSTHQNTLGANSSGARLARNAETADGYRASNGSTNLFWYVYGPTPTGVAQYADNFYSEADPLKSNGFLNEVSRSTGSTGTPSSSAPEAPLRLGASAVDNALPAQMKFAELLIFSRALHEYERQLVREYIAARYGIAAPSLTGADREIMSLLPFGWLDAAKYTTSGGKVTAFLDRARPGHSFVQSATENQVSLPTPSTTFKSQPVATCTGAQLYQSSLTPSAWAFTADGTGFDSAWVGRSSDATGTRVLFGTTSTEAVQGLSVFRTAQSYQASVYRNGGVVMGPAVTAGAANLNTPFVMRVSHSTARSPQYACRVSGMAEATGSYASVPAHVAPQTSMQLFANKGPALQWNGDWAGAIFFDRTLTERELSRLNAALKTKWGIAP